MLKNLIQGLVIIAIAAGWARGGESRCNSAFHFEPVKVVSAIETPYPFRSIVSGTVILKVTVGASGKIENIGVINGIPSLTEAAERSLQEWRFEPGRIDGKPIVAAIVTAFSFNRGGFNSSIWEAGERGPQEKGQDLSIEPVQVIFAAPAWYPVAGTATGTVILKVMVDKSGAIKDIEVMHGIASFTRIAIATVRKWKFTPAEYTGKSVSGFMMASFVFSFSATRR